MINLELPANLVKARELARLGAEHVMRPISREYDRREHEPPQGLEALNTGLSRSGGNGDGRPSDKGRVDEEAASLGDSRNGRNLWTLAMVEELCWGDVGLFLARPGSGLGNAAIMAVGTPEQKARWGGRWASMAITEPEAGSDSKNISTTAVADGDQWVINGEKIFVTDGDRCDCAVVWATLDKSKGKAAIKSFLVEKGTPGFAVTRLEHKLGIRASDTATLVFTDCRVPRENLLGGDSEVANDAEAGKRAFGGVMQTFDNTRPIVAIMATGCARAALDTAYEIFAGEGCEFDYGKPRFNCTALEAEFQQMEADLEAARLLAYKAAWMMDNKQPNSLAASMAKAKAGRVGNYITLRCVEICGSLGYSEDYLLEKFARDSKILDIFEGTQQIQQLIIARQVLGKSSSELK